MSTGEVDDNTKTNKMGARPRLPLTFCEGRQSVPLETVAKFSVWTQTTFCTFQDNLTMLRTVFSFNLGEKVIPGKVAVGSFDGVTPSIVAATPGEKVLVYTNDRTTTTSIIGTSSKETSKVNFLNFNQTITAIGTGRLDENSAGDLLFVGTPTSLYAYDVDNNKDVFYRDIPDGVNCLAVGKLGLTGAVGTSASVILSGGNCALQGFNNHGEDVYWTVTGDNITSISLCDFDNDSQNEILVGSEDYDIRVFKGDAIVHEMSETDAISCLCPIMPETFGYALTNGTVGIYHQQERIWRIKSKNQAVSLISKDINGDGRPELITGWSAGKMDARNVETGEVIFKDTFQEGIAAILISDYNCDGIEEILVVTVDGEVRGYQVVSSRLDTDYSEEDVLRHEEDLIRDLMKRRQAMMTELATYEENNRLVRAGVRSSDWKKPAEEGDTFGAIPADTQVKATLTICPDDQHSPSVQLTLSTTNDTIIRSAVMFAEGIFTGESFVIHPPDNEVEESLKISLRPEKDASIDLHIKVLVGWAQSIHYHVFELTRRLPKFSMFALIPPDVPRILPSGKVSLTFGQSEVKGEQIQSWITKSFLIGDGDESFGVKTSSLDVTFLAIRDSSLLCLRFDEKTGNLDIHTDNVDLAGEIVQSLVSDCLAPEGQSIDSLDIDSTAVYPSVVNTIKELVAKVEDLQSVRSQLAADIADSSSLVKSLLIRAEDARLLKQYQMMRSLYLDLQSVNRELLNGFRIREKNQSDLVTTLKQINLWIQRMGNTRVGRYKNDLIQACRLAIKQNNLASLSKIITAPSSAVASSVRPTTATVNIRGN